MKFLAFFAVLVVLCAPACRSAGRKGPTVVVLRGDVNCNGQVDASDPVLIREWLFKNVPLPCAQNADANRDGVIDISDSIFLEHYLYRAGAAPPQN